MKRRAVSFECSSRSRNSTHVKLNVTKVRQDEMRRVKEVRPFKEHVCGRPLLRSRTCALGKSHALDEVQNSAVLRAG